MKRNRGVAIVVDSAASLPENLAKRPGLYVVPMRVTIGDRTYEDGRELSANDFYRLLRRSSTPPSTSAPSPASFLETIRRAVGEAPAVLCMTVARRFSASFDAARSATIEAKEELADTEVSLLDTGTAGGAEGLVALEAWRAAARGERLRETEAAARKVMGRVRMLALLDTLLYLSRSGRVPRIVHVGTSVLQIKPIFELEQGRIHTLARPRTRRSALKRLVELMRDRTGPHRVHATVMHADAVEAAEQIRERIEGEFSCEELFVSEFTPVMGAHIGPGLVGIAFWSE